MRGVPIYAILLLGWRQTRCETRLTALQAQLNSRLYQLLGGIDKIQMAGVEDRALYEYLKPYTEVKRLTMEQARIGNLATIFSSLMSGAFSLVLYSVALGQLDTTLTMGSFMGFTAAFGSFSAAVLQAVSATLTLNDLLPLYDRARPVLETPPELEANTELPGDLTGDIERLDKRELRKKFGVVLQDGKLISGSIYDNIVLTAPNATPERVQQVVRAVGLADDIARMPMGLHTMLGENSGTLSGAQQQRILIARAIVGNPQILFFDEATSALDNVTQRQVSDSLAKLQVTRVVIAHRLSTIRQCDRILVLDGGTVREAGNYDELMAQKGMFYALASRQLS